jgi:hypothetical protein
VESAPHAERARRQEQVILLKDMESLLSKAAGFLPRHMVDLQASHKDLDGYKSIVRLPKLTRGRSVPPARKLSKSDAHNQHGHAVPMFDCHGSWLT